MGKIEEIEFGDHVISVSCEYRITARATGGVGTLEAGIYTDADENLGLFGTGTGSAGTTQVRVRGNVPVYGDDYSIISPTINHQFLSVSGGA